MTTPISCSVAALNSYGITTDDKPGIGYTIGVVCNDLPGIGFQTGCVTTNIPGIGFASILPKGSPGLKVLMGGDFGTTGGSTSLPTIPHVGLAQGNNKKLSKHGVMGSGVFDAISKDEATFTRRNQYKNIGNDPSGVPWSRSNYISGIGSSHKRRH